MTARGRGTRYSRFSGSSHYREPRRQTGQGLATLHASPEFPLGGDYEVFTRGDQPGLRLTSAAAARAGEADSRLLKLIRPTSMGIKFAAQSDLL
jgi:hypothetical protein